MKKSFLDFKRVWKAGHGFILNYPVAGTGWSVCLFSLPETWNVYGGYLAAVQATVQQWGGGL